MRALDKHSSLFRKIVNYGQKSLWHFHLGAILEPAGDIWNEEEDEKMKRRHFGILAFGILTIDRMTPDIMDCSNKSSKCCQYYRVFSLFFVLLSVILMNVILMNVILLNVILLNVILLNVILLNVILLSIIVMVAILLNVILLNVSFW